MYIEIYVMKVRILQKSSLNSFKKVSKKSIMSASGIQLMLYNATFSNETIMGQYIYNFFYLLAFYFQILLQGYTSKNYFRACLTLTVDKNRHFSIKTLERKKFQLYKYHFSFYKEIFRGNQLIYSA